MTQDLPSPDVLRQLLRYEPHTGKLFWKERQDVPRWWNTKYAGKEAFTKTRQDGYVGGKINSKSHLAHRVIWAIFYGYWPKNEIDHKNRIRDDNRIENLRECNRSQNMHNAKIVGGSTSKYTGVSWNKATNSWRSTIAINGKKVHLGLFDSEIDASIAYNKRLNSEYGDFAIQPYDQ